MDFSLKQKKITMTTFAFQKLQVWQKAIEFADQVMWLSKNLDTDKYHYKVIEQLEAASTSVSLNIAEGKGRKTKQDFIRFLYIARGSLYETVSLLELIHKRDWITQEQLTEIEEQALEITKMLMGLIKNLSGNKKATAT